MMIQGRENGKKKVFWYIGAGLVGAVSKSIVCGKALEEPNPIGA